MKTPQQILFRVAELRVELRQAEKEYTGLHQIDKLSGDGTRLQAQMNRLRGQIAVLGWVMYADVSEDVATMDLNKYCGKQAKN